MAAINQALSSVKPPSAEAQAILSDALKGDTMIPELARNIPSASSSSSLQRRRANPTPESAAVLAQLKTFTHFAAAAYCNATLLSSWTCNGPCGDATTKGTRSVTVFWDAGTGMQAFAGVNDALQTIVVSFRGSSDFLNWVNNLNLIKADSPFPSAPSDVKVHSGFLNIYNALRSRVRSTLTNLKAANPSYSLTITGHSLGGAVASLYAADLVNLFPSTSIGLYTMGEPRVGNKAWYSFYSGLNLKGVYRGVNYNDIVPHLPPEFMSFNHHAQERWVDAGGVLDDCDDGANNGEGEQVRGLWQRDEN
ncbi:hypothetical protein HK101_011026 [Irineochytrium annulatum]|nr:hypothetical protein HK101_011026 [Irineochytrium annulatum]